MIAYLLVNVILHALSLISVEILEFFKRILGTSIVLVPILSPKRQNLELFPSPLLSFHIPPSEHRTKLLRDKKKICRIL